MKILAKTKLWLIIALAVVVAGVAMFAIFGFNQTADNKASYEVQVAVDQNVNGAASVAKETAEKYFNEINYKYCGSLTQEYDDGAEYIYKFDTAKEFNKDELKSRIEEALNEKGLSGLNLEVTVNYKETVVTSGVGVWKLVLACAISLVAAFIITAIVNKFASAFTVVVNGVFAFIIHLALVSVTRVPAFPALIVGESTAVILTMLFSFFIVCGFKEGLKANEKADVNEITEKELNRSLKTLCLVAILGIFAAIFFAFTFKVYFVYTGLQIAIAIITAFLVSCVSTPSLWKVFKGIKGRK